EDLLALDRLVLGERVVDDDLQGLFGTDQVRQQVGTAPARHQAEEGLRERKGRYPRGDGAVGAVQSHLDTATHGRAVDQCKGRNIQFTELAEHVVAQFADRPGLLVVLDRRYTGQVGADREDEGFTGDGH